MNDLKKKRKRKGNLAGNKCAMDKTAAKTPH